MTALETARRTLAFEIAMKGCTATASDGRTVRGLFGPRKEDPVALAMEGADNAATPNRYQFRAVDDAAVLKEGDDVAVRGLSYRIVDIDQLAAGDGFVGVRATMLALGEA